MGRKDGIFIEAGHANGAISHDRATVCILEIRR